MELDEVRVDRILMDEVLDDSGEHEVPVVDRLS